VESQLLQAVENYRSKEEMADQLESNMSMLAAERKQRTRK